VYMSTPASEPRSRARSQAKADPRRIGPAYSRRFKSA
jgi:hypothetical protein